MTVSVERDDFDFDVAVSFAGEDRPIVEALVRRMQEFGHRIFYDADSSAEIWGEDLVEYFDQVYRVRSRYAVIFISHAYATKSWTIHERRSVLARALNERQAYALPVRLDDTELAGLRPTVGYWDARMIGIEEIARTLHAKLSGNSEVRRHAINHVPRSTVEMQQIILDRPAGWEYLYFTGALRHHMATTEPHYIDHEMRYAEPGAVHVEDNEVLTFLSRKTNEVQNILTNLNRIMGSDVQERILGQSADDLDPEKIERLAGRWNDIYRSLISWAASVRGTVIGAEFEELIELLAQFVDEPIDGYRRFVDEFATLVDGLPVAIEQGRAVNLHLTYTVTIGDGVSVACMAEIERLHQAGNL